jgi:hypothetical protein
MSPERAIERFVQAFNRRSDGLRCARCRTVLHRHHRHLVELDAHQLLCACNGCILSAYQDDHGRHRVVPESVRGDPSWAPGWQRWDSLGVTVRLAFFVWLSRLARWVAVVPSAIGAVGREVPAGLWSEFLQESRVARHITADVEALLLRAAESGPFDAYVVPIDVCHELVSLVRQTWHGPDGGDAARTELDGFFERLRRRMTQRPALVAGK